MAEQVVMSNEQFTQLLETLRLNTNNTSQINIPSPPIQSGNFTNCASRFNGDRNSDVNAFIDAIEIYKDCMRISDDNAFRGLPMLLDSFAATCFAATWFRGIKSSINTWNEAINLLRIIFGTKKPPHFVYRELFSREQDSKTPTDVFICKARSILAQLPENTLTETVQLDMVYGLLNKKIREKVPRDKIETFKRSASIDFCMFETKEMATVSPRSRPYVFIDILGLHGTGIIDTAAKQSVAGQSLYKALKAKGQTFSDETVFIKLADGNGKLENVLVTFVDVILQGRAIPTNFIILPNAENNTLLGIDFLEDAKMILNIFDRLWNFADTPGANYDLLFEALPQRLHPTQHIDLSSFDNLRADEGTMLSSDQHPELSKIILAFEDSQNEEFSKWTDRGYLMTSGVLYRYADDDTEEAQLVVPIHEREQILKDYHDAPTAAHYGAERTLQRIAKRYYFTGMRRYVTDYVKQCVECQRYKASNQKPPGLLQTPVYAQRFETLSIDLFGPLPESPSGEKWILIVEDISTKWVELFGLVRATAEDCARVLIDEIFLRFGLPRRIISDNGTQFVSSIMQQTCYCLDIKQTSTPVYHPSANMVERKNRDLKPRLAILVGEDHTSWLEKLPLIRFAMNSAKCESTGQTAAYLTFGREMRTPDDIKNDFRTVVLTENFLPQITPYLQRMATTWKESRDINEVQQDKRKCYADAHRRKAPSLNIGDKVWVTGHFLSNAAKKITSKFIPKRDGPYEIIKQVSPVSYEIQDPNTANVPLGVYHVSSLTPVIGLTEDGPVRPIKRRGRPPKRKRPKLVLRRDDLITKGGDCNNLRVCSQPAAV
ncbi:hypothetical protein NQ314_018522 [Rhamnusium bicolor]|uniref:RNA-directed DNA polymerase n=1 Tax=Rhamnusium bicolor TaxID=1586634 RepID=A0AAV8WSW9_9CUCU|nr:hypothetical protein NQ314_018522 [Rhamnusium bicolor]